MMTHQLIEVDLQNIRHWIGVENPVVIWHRIAPRWQFANSFWQLWPTHCRWCRALVKLTKTSTASMGEARHHHQGGSGGGWRRWRTLVGCNFASYHNWTECDTKNIKKVWYCHVKSCKGNHSTNLYFIILPFQQLLSWEESSVRILVHFVSACCLRKEALSAPEITLLSTLNRHILGVPGLQNCLAFRRHLRTVAQFFGLKSLTWLD